MPTDPTKRAQTEQPMNETQPGLTFHMPTDVQRSSVPASMITESPVGGPAIPGTRVEVTPSSTFPIPGMTTPRRAY